MAPSPRILVADPGRHSRTIVCDILRGFGIRDLLQAASADDLRGQVDQHRPGIIFMGEFPELSGLAFAKQIRAGYNFVPRETSIILLANAPTRAFLEAARAVGVDEIVAVPFTTQALMARLRSVLDRPRPFVDCPTYVGPCRRRVMLQDYKGPLRRAADPAMAAPSGPLWSMEGNRSAVRLCIQKMSEYRGELRPAQYSKLREVYQSVMKLETRDDQDGDATMGEAARSFGRYISGLGAGKAPDMALLHDHIDAIHELALGELTIHHERATLVANLEERIQGSLHSGGSSACFAQ